MKYYFRKVTDLNFEDTLQKVTDSLGAEGFGVLTEIDVKQTLKKKLDVDFRKYKILGACNAPFAYEALKNERMIGTMLPCNIIVQETDDGKTEIAAVDPIASMTAVENVDLARIAVQVQAKLHKVIDSI